MYDEPARPEGGVRGGGTEGVTTDEEDSPRAKAAVSTERRYCSCARGLSDEKVVLPEVPYT